MSAELRPITRDEAHAFIRQHHRHHGAPLGELWRHAVHDAAGNLTGVATIGRPVARALDDGLTVEITRLCTDGEPNACSILYGAARRAADAKGYRRGLTYILASEWDRFDDAGRRIGGSSVRAPNRQASDRRQGGARLGRMADEGAEAMTILTFSNSGDNHAA